MNQAMHDAIHEAAKCCTARAIADNDATFNELATMLKALELVLTEQEGRIHAIENETLYLTSQEPKEQHEPIRPPTSAMQRMRNAALRSGDKGPSQEAQVHHL